MYEISYNETIECEGGLKEHQKQTNNETLDVYCGFGSNPKHSILEKVEVTTVTRNQHHIKQEICFQLETLRKGPFCARKRSQHKQIQRLESNTARSQGKVAN